MSQQRNIFDKNIESVLIIDSIFKYMGSHNVEAFDITELLRAEFVLIVSALDYYIHEIVRKGLMDQIDESERCNAKKLYIPFPTVKTILRVDSEEERARILSEQIKEITSKYSYQAPHAIEKALGMIDIKKIWTLLSNILNKPGEDIRGTLSMIVNRRNKIAHEADIDFMTGEKNNITSTTITECLHFVKEFVYAVDQITTMP